MRGYLFIQSTWVTEKEEEENLSGSFCRSLEGL